MSVLAQRSNCIDSRIRSRKSTLKLGMHLKNNKKKIVGSILSVSALVILFQNCSGGFSPVSMSSLGSTSGSTSSASDPATPVPQGKVDVFVAAGHMGRTVMSCDDGKTWINDMSANDAARCWRDPKEAAYVECDHTPYSGTGLDAGDGAIYVQNGWGFNGTVRKSTNGKDWTVIRQNGWGGGVVYAKNSVLSIFEYNWGLSTDSGTTFSPGTVDGYDHGFVQRAGNTFIIVGRAGGSKTQGFSPDQGKTWINPTVQPGWMGTFAEGNGMLISLGTLVVQGGKNIGYAARSTDGGATWKATQVFEAEGQVWDARVVFDGSQFVSWSNGMTFKSSDAVTWTQTKTVDANGNRPWWSAAVSVNPKTKAFVAINNSWGSWYDTQWAYESKDGILWTALDRAHFSGGHPISRITTVELDASVCPATK